MPQTLTRNRRRSRSRNGTDRLSKIKKTPKPPTQAEPEAVAQQTTAASTTPPTLLLIDSASAKSELRNCLAQLPVALRLGSVADALNRQEEFDAIIIAARGENLVATRDLLESRRDSSAPPVFVVLKTVIDNATETELYHDGASAVFEWTRERVDLPRMLANLLRLEPAMNAANADEALEKAIRHRLAAEGLVATTRNLELICCDGFVTVKGAVNQLWQRNFLLDAIAAVPGVSRIIAAELMVLGPASKTEPLTAVVQDVMRAENLTTGSVDPHASGNVLVLRGTVGSHGDQRHLAELFGNLPGVRQFENRVVVSPQLAKRDAATADQVAKLVDKFNVNDPAVRVVGGVAVVEGRADSLDAAESALSAIRSEPAVQRVVDKMTLRPAAAA